MFVFALAPGLRVLHNGEAVFQTQPVREPPESKAGAPEVSEFSVTVQIDRTPNNVIMHMGFVNVSADNKGVVAFVIVIDLLF